jgi:hypothetical protein
MKLKGVRRMQAGILEETLILNINRNSLLVDA